VRSRLHEWSDRIFVTVGGVLSGLTEDLRTVRSKTHDGLKAVFELWQKEKKTFREVYKAEKAAYCENLIRGHAEEYFKQHQIVAQIQRGQMPSLEDLLPSGFATQLMSLKYFFEMEVGKEQAQHVLDQFLNSGAINEAPFSTVGAAMYASLAMKAAAGQKEIPNQGTVTDVNIVSILLPYCDAMFMDNKCRALLQDIPKDHALPYPCLVFSPNTGEDFIRYLTEIRDSASAEHLRLIEEVYGPDPLKPQSGIYGVGERRRSSSS
jgi:hypothetical protein